MPVSVLLLDAATPSLALALAFAAAAAAYVHDLRMAYAGLRLAFADSLPRATIEKIARRPHLLKLEGETRTVTYLVCGVRGLAGVAAAYRDDAAGFTSLMQKILTPLIDQALAHGGTIDRLTADGFAAFWNAPLDDTDHALHACEAANGMAIVSARVTEDLAQERPDAPVAEIGVGVATGSVIAGGFGGYGRMGYSVNGDAVALAQRIQALSPHYGPALVVSDETKRLAERGFAFLEIDTIALAGPPTTLYAIMGNPVNKASTEIPRFDRVPRSYLPGDPQAAMADGARLDRAMPPPVGGEPEALRPAPGPHRLLREASAGRGTGTGAFRADPGITPNLHGRGEIGRATAGIKPPAPRPVPGWRKTSASRISHPDRLAPGRCGSPACSMRR